MQMGFVGSGVGVEFRFAALEASSRSHTPYIWCRSGVALVDCEGKVYVTHGRPNVFGVRQNFVVWPYFF
jgi:hypothetical protein